jgi:DNA-binding NarL/FixJ family response regulator
MAARIAEGAMGRKISGPVNWADCVKIVSVDDSTFMRRVVQLLADSCDDIQCVAGVGTAAAAWRVLEDGEIDVVILDLELPDADGLSEIARFIADAGCAVIVLSGCSRHRAAAMAQGASAYFEKIGLIEEREAFLAAIRHAAARSARNAPPRRGSDAIAHRTRSPLQG